MLQGTNFLLKEGGKLFHKVWLAHPAGFNGCLSLLFGVVEFLWLNPELATHVFVRSAHAKLSPKRTSCSELGIVRYS